MGVDKNFCMSSFLAFRYIIDGGMDFFEGIHHQTKPLPPAGKLREVKTAAEIDRELACQFQSLDARKPAILLSGGMDSACLASYMRGSDAYTFRFLDGAFQEDELERAERFAETNKMRLHYVDISWDSTTANLDALLRRKGAPVHSIEPQIAQAAHQALHDGVDLMVIGDAADYVFGGMDQLHAKDWLFDEFRKRYTYIEPAEVLSESEDMRFAYEKYRRGSGIDFISFMHEYADIESYSSYDNAFQTMGLSYLDPYETLVMAEPLDLQRVRNGESKYLIRELFRLRYPDIPLPEKNPMPRPVDVYFRDWHGPARPEFLPGLDMGKFTGNQKWQLWCLEYFLNLFDPPQEEKQ